MWTTKTYGVGAGVQAEVAAKACALVASRDAQALRLSRDVGWHELTQHEFTLS